MRSVYQSVLRAAASVVVFACLSSCSTSVNTQAVTTHPFEAVGEALFIGELGGTAECLWLGDDEATSNGLIFPEGTIAQPGPDETTEVSLEGSWSARTGDRVAVSGASSDDWESCVGNDELVIVVGFVDVCPHVVCD